jgi:hypothetical protein
VGDYQGVFCPQALHLCVKTRELRLKARKPAIGNPFALESGVRASWHELFLKPIRAQR